MSSDNTEYRYKELFIFIFAARLQRAWRSYKRRRLETQTQPALTSLSPLTQVKVIPPADSLESQVKQELSDHEEEFSETESAIAAITLLSPEENQGESHQWTHVINFYICHDTLRPCKM